MGIKPTFPSFREYTFAYFCSLSTSPITRHSENCAAVMIPVSEPINGSTGSEGCAAAQYVREKGLGGTALNKQMKAPAVRGLSFFRLVGPMRHCLPIRLNLKFFRSFSTKSQYRGRCFAGSAGNSRKRRLRRFCRTGRWNQERQSRRA